MPDTPQQSTSSAPAKRSRPPGEMGGHTVMPWEQGESTQGTASSHVPAGSDAATPASGGSSKSVPPPSGGRGKDGLGQGAGASTVKAADDMMPSAAQSMGRSPSTASASSRPPPGSAGKPGRPNARSNPQELESQHPEGAEWRQGVPQTSSQVEEGDAPADAMAGAPPTARKATPQATKDNPEGQLEGGDETRQERSGHASRKPVTPTLSGTRPKPEPHEVDEVAKASTPQETSATGTAASSASAHPTHPERKEAVGQHSQDDALIEALDKRLAEMLARALHETVATAVRETLRSERPPAPPPVQPAKKA